MPTQHIPCHETSTRNWQRYRSVSIFLKANALNLGLSWHDVTYFVNSNQQQQNVVEKHGTGKWHHTPMKSVAQTKPVSCQKEGSVWHQLKYTVISNGCFWQSLRADKRQNLSYLLRQVIVTIFFSIFWWFSMGKEEDRVKSTRIRVTTIFLISEPEI